MARKVSGKQANSPFGKSYFARVSLTTEDEKRIKELQAAGRLSLAEVGDLVLEGLKFSLNCDRNHHAVVASFSYKTGTEGDETAILTGRGSTPANAVASLLYKHLYLTDGSWIGGGDDFFKEGDFG